MFVCGLVLQQFLSIISAGLYMMQNDMAIIARHSCKEHTCRGTTRVNIA